jgi:hypothetical protein
MVSNDDFDIDISVPKKDSAIAKQVREKKRLNDIVDSVTGEIYAPVQSSVVVVKDSTGLEIVEEYDEYEEEQKATKLSLIALNTQLANPHKAPTELIKMVIGSKFQKPNVNVNIELKGREELLEFMRGLGKVE